MIGLVVVGAAGYVLGTKAGRARYEQISKAARVVATNPATKKILSAGRQKLSDTLNTRPQLEPLEPIDERTTILVPHEHLRR
ncbi:hypothetical protein [Antrihabitans sp. YC2-6]|uniref:hypothetical protein n=1 Tax=Antrihabitans sp. YC2-6 TaxID=2799498 RepID=UPI0018F44387|nr:hypothetical protein [Antrihabitans sp. YC2-6]MBJ8346885.1 hypothetical protein [Antrihabitans sp. YC2-6]